MNNTDNTETVHYIITFFSFILLAGCFATTLFTGKPALIQFDSLAGSFLLGSVFLFYTLWFVYEDATTQQISISQSLLFNIKKNPTLIFICLYWIVLILFPFLCNIF